MVAQGGGEVVHSRLTAQEHQAIIMPKPIVERLRDSLFIFYEIFNPNRWLGLVVFRNFRRVIFVRLLMSDSELSRIKNKRKASYKIIKTERTQEVI